MELSNIFQVEYYEEAHLLFISFAKLYLIYIVTYKGGL